MLLVIIYYIVRVVKCYITAFYLSQPLAGGICLLHLSASVSGCLSFRTYCPLHHIHTCMYLHT